MKLVYDLPEKHAVELKANCKSQSNVNRCYRWWRRVSVCLGQRGRRISRLQRRKQEPGETHFPTNFPGWDLLGSTLRKGRCLVTDVRLYRWHIMMPPGDLVLGRCTKQISDWMNQSFPQLISDKTEIMFFESNIKAHSSASVTNIKDHKPGLEPGCGPGLRPKLWCPYWDKISQLWFEEWIKNQRTRVLVGFRKPSHVFIYSGLNDCNAVSTGLRSGSSLRTRETKSVQFSHLYAGFLLVKEMILNLFSWFIKNWMIYFLSLRWSGTVPHIILQSPGFLDGYETGQLIVLRHQIWTP